MRRLDFDTATEALRRLHHSDETLPRLAHAAVCSSSEYAAALLSFLAEQKATVERAAVPERRSITIPARSNPEDIFDVPSDW